MTDETPKTLLEAVRYFSDIDRCHEAMRNVKWPDGQITCPKCGGDRCSDIKNRPGTLTCNKRGCRKQFSYKVGTIFEDSPLGLDKWFVAVWCVANCKNGISSYELARAIGVRQPSAWFMLHRIREAMKTGTFKKLDGEVEADETYVGGAAKNMHAHKREKVITGRGAVGKTAVQGVLQRGGEVRTFAATKTDGATLRGNVMRNVDPSARVYTDALPAYDGLSRRYWHQSIDHTVAFVRDRVHTNGLENFWCLLKRTLGGTYTHVAPFHLHRYCSEQEYRFNTRKLGDGSRFFDLLGRVMGKRLTYRRLCAIGDCGFMGIE